MSSFGQGVGASMGCVTGTLLSLMLLFAVLVAGCGGCLYMGARLKPTTDAGTRGATAPDAGTGETTGR